MNGQSLGHVSRSAKRSISAVIGCIVSGIGIGLASTQVVYDQDLVPAPPIDVHPDDQVSRLDALPRKKDDNLLRTDVPPTRPELGAEIPRLLGGNRENPFTKTVSSDGREKAAPSNAPAAENSFDTFYWYAYAFHKSRNFDMALEYYSLAIVCSPRSVEAHGRRASVLRDLGRFSEALNDLNFVIQHEPDSYKGYAERGHVLCRLVNSNSDDAAFKPALADIARALELNPDDPFSRFVRGMIAARRGDYDGAITDLTWAIERGQDFGEARYYRSFSFAMKGETDRAIADLTVALKENPTDHILYARRARLYAEKEDFDRALADFDQVVRLRPDDAIVYLQRTALFLRKGDNGRAMADIERVVRLEPNAAFARLSYAIMLYFIESNSDRAVAEMDKAINLEPGVIVYPGFRCFLNGRKTKFGLAFKDMALCTAILLQSRIKSYVGADLTQNRFGVAVDLIHSHRNFRFLARIDFGRGKFLVGLGLADDSADLRHNDLVSGLDRQLINQNVLNLLVAKFAGASN